MIVSKPYYGHIKEKQPLRNTEMRTFVNVSWNNASEVYDGSQQQNKHFNPNGTAATHLYADGEVKPVKKASTRTIKEKIIPQEYTLNKLDVQEAELRKAYKAGEVNPDEFNQLMHALTQKRNRAAKSRAKALGESLDIEEEIEENIQVAHIKPMPTKVYVALVLICAIVMLIVSN